MRSLPSSDAPVDGAPGSCIGAHTASRRKSERDFVVVEAVVRRRLRRCGRARAALRRRLRAARRPAFATFTAALARAGTAAAAEHLHFVGDDIGTPALDAVLFVFLGAQAAL